MSGWLAERAPKAVRGNMEDIRGLLHGVEVDRGVDMYNSLNEWCSGNPTWAVSIRGARARAF